MKMILPLLICLFLACCLYAGETKTLEWTSGLNIYEDHSFLASKSALLPDTYLPESGLSGQVKLALDAKLKAGDFAFKASGLGILPEAKEAAFSNRITELYATCPLGSFFIDAGKKKITQSVSFLKSPIDFALNSSRDPSKNKDQNLQFVEGRWMANLDFYTDFGVLGASYMPKLDFTNDAVRYFSAPQTEQFMGRYSVNINGMDTAFALSKDSIWKAGLNLAVSVGDYFEIHAEGAYLESTTRLSLKTNQITIGFNPVLMQPVTAGLVLNESVTIQNPYEAIIGGSWNTEWFDLMTEYCFNSSGYDYNQWKDFLNTAKDSRKSYEAAPSDPLQMAKIGSAQNQISAYGTAGLCQHYLMLRLVNPSSEKLALSALNLMNLEDFSGLFMPSVSYNGWDHLNLSISATFSYGDDFSEYKLITQDWMVKTEIDLIF